MVERQTFLIVFNEEGIQAKGVEGITLTNVIHVEPTDFLVYFVTLQENPKLIDTLDIRTDHIDRIELLL